MDKVKQIKKVKVLGKDAEELNKLKATLDNIHTFDDWRRHKSNQRSEKYKRYNPKTMEPVEKSDYKFVGTKVWTNNNSSPKFGKDGKQLPEKIEVLQHNE